MTNKDNDNLIIGINLGDFGSTGNIMLNSLEYAHLYGPFDVLACIPYETKQTNKVRTLSFGVRNSRIRHYYYGALRRLKLPLINDGNYYRKNTNKLIKIIKNHSRGYNKVIVHLHNIHMCNLDVCILYKWLDKSDFKVLYTLHDVWPLTGGCYYNSHINCNKWQTNCKKCPQHIRYSAWQLKRRTKLLNKIKGLVLVPVSKWAESEIKKSKLNTITTIVNYGETNLEIHKPFINIKKQLNVENKKMLLFVSAYWNDWKGYKYIYEISKRVPSDYVLVVIGSFDIRDFRNIINIPYVDHQKLSSYYKSADVYVSVTQAEQLGLTTCEAQICGTPVVGFGHGGSKETIIDGKTGIIVGEENNVDKMVQSIIHVIEDKPFKEDDIIASGNRFKKYECAKRQLNIYKRIINE